MRHPIDFVPVRLARVGCAAALLLAAAACGGDTAPLGAPAKLLVTNSTCAAGSCSAIRVLVFPVDQPNTPGGYWSIDLGTVSTAAACLTIPATATFRVTDTGTGATTTLTWTTAKGASLGAVTSDQSAIQASPSTGSFVPAAGAGWSVALPGSAVPSASAPCR